MPKILILDNYDSFTYNLFHYVDEFDDIDVDVIRNDEINLNVVDRYDGIILSPGPGLPEESGLLLPLIERYKDSKKIFGVCLGQQAIAEVFGGTLENLEEVHHGVSTLININQPQHYLFKGLPAKLMWAVTTRGLYHNTLFLVA